MTININELRTVLARHGTSVLNEDEILELLDRIEAAESDALEQARLNGMGASREAALMAKLEVAEKERESWKGVAQQFGNEADELRTHLSFAKDELNRLRAKIEAMERQEPYSYIYEYSNPIDGSPVWRDKPGYWNAQFPKSSKPLYLAPGAQPAPSLPEGWKAAPVEPTYEMLEAGEGCVCPTYTDTPVSVPFDVYRAMLAAAPEAKP